METIRWHQRSQHKTWLIVPEKDLLQDQDHVPEILSQKEKLYPQQMQSSRKKLKTPQMEKLSSFDTNAILKTALELIHAPEHVPPVLWSRSLWLLGRYSWALTTEQGSTVFQIAVANNFQCIVIGRRVVK